jgi:hypothetical protein
MLAYLLVLAGNLLANENKKPLSCGEVTLQVALKAGGSFSRRVNADGLTFVVKADDPKERGWDFALNDSRGNDLVYPVNPPLRFNPSQTLGLGYGQSAKQSLQVNRELQFLLSSTDYDRFWPIVTNALWPYSAPHPDRAADEYLNALSKLRTGRLRLKILSSDVAPDDAVRAAEFQIELIAPPDFRFDPSLKPRPAACASK